MKYKKSLKGQIVFKGSLSKKRIRERRIELLVIIALIILPLINYFLGSIPGVIITISIGLIVYFLNPYGVIKVCRIKKYK